MRTALLRCAALAAALLFAVLHAPAAAAPGDLARFSESLQALADRAAPAVVEISVSRFGTLGESPAPVGAFGTSRASGSGVMLTADGYIVTNAHVVGGARRIRVRLAGVREGAPGRSILKPARREVAARLVGFDLETDLAVIKVDVSGAAHLELGDSDALRQGQLVVAVGNPLGLENSVTLGVVSALARQLEPESRMVYLQTDATINPGNSGGPLIDASGKVVGINTLIFSQSGGSEGIGFAAPSNIVRHVFEQLRTTGRVRRGHIGAFAQTITPALADGLGLAQDWGVVLADIAPGGPADQAGLKRGDVVVTLDGKTMENGRQFDVNLYQRSIGDPVRLDVSRAGQRRTLVVAVSERDEDPARFANLVTQEENHVRGLGILGIEVNDDLLPMLPWLRERSGVVVAALSIDAPSGDEGPLHPGDVIHAVNRTPVTSLASLRAAVDALPDGGAAAVTVNRRGRMQYVGLEILRD